MIPDLKGQPSPYNINQYIKCPEIILDHLNQHGSSRKVLLDFGCGHGVKALSMALRNPDSEVVGIDITEAFSQSEKFARDQLGLTALPKNLRFHQIKPGQSLSSVAKPDVIYSWSVLEHVDRPILPAVIADMYASIDPDGIIFTQIAPLYFSPFGSHLNDFCVQPWAHLIHSHADFRKLIVDATGVPPEESKRRKWMFERFEELNEITHAELAGYFSAAGFNLAYEKSKKTGLKPPEFLDQAYDPDALRINEIVMIHTKKPVRQEKSGKGLFGFGKP